MPLNPHPNAVRNHQPVFGQIYLKKKTFNLLGTRGQKLYDQFVKLKKENAADIKELEASGINFHIEGYNGEDKKVGIQVSLRDKRGRFLAVPIGLNGAFFLDAQSFREARKQRKVPQYTFFKIGGHQGFTPEKILTTAISLGKLRLRLLEKPKSLKGFEERMLEMLRGAGDGSS
jgi:hypothetical protein